MGSEEGGFDWMILAVDWKSWWVNRRVEDEGMRREKVEERELKWSFVRRIGLEC